MKRNPAVLAEAIDKFIPVLYTRLLGYPMHGILVFGEVTILPDYS